jgi:hypothetical protein
MPILLGRTYDKNYRVYHLIHIVGWNFQIENIEYTHENIVLL